MSTSITYVRMFADADGNSHLEEGLTLQLEPTNFVPPAPAIHVSALKPATAYAFLSVPVGYFGDWHPSPKRQWLFFISGQRCPRFTPDQTGPRPRVQLVADWRTGTVDRLWTGKS